MKTQWRAENISTTISLIGLAFGFSVLGLLIVAKEHQGGASIAGGILGILLGAVFLIFAGLRWKSGGSMRDGVRAEVVRATEIVSEMPEVANALW